MSVVTAGARGLLSPESAATTQAMCGVAGMMMRGGRAPDKVALARLVAALRHRGPDSDGLYVGGATGLAETRLAIVDVAGGAQPLYGPRGAVLILNGEIYNAPELRAELAPEPFETLSDCEPAVHLFERLGPAYAERLRGMYGAAIYDPERRRLTLSRDSFGIKPLYYVQTPAFFAFASEPQALFAAGLARPELVTAKRDELLQLKHVTGRETIFAGVARVERGETLVVEDGAVVERTCLPPPEVKPRPTTLTAALDEFERVMTDSVAVHLRTDVPYGLFFSGGIDSTILLTLMRRLASTPVQALTLGYAGDLPGDESRAALEIANAAGADCRRIEMSADDFWRFAPRIAAALDDPTTDAAILPTWMLGRAAREQGLKVVLGGEGADELFGGYSRYRRARAPWLGRGEGKRGVFDALPELAERFAGWSAGFDAVAARERRRSRSALQALQAIDLVERLPNSLLVKLDRCLMANSVEGRTPFLDGEVAAFAGGLPDRLKASFRCGKVLLREWLARAEPASRPFARKQGFNPPVGAWIAARGDLLGRLVSEAAGVAVFADARAVAAVFADAGRNAQPAWSLLFYALWHAHHLQGIAADGTIDEVLDEAAVRGPPRRTATVGREAAAL